MEVNMNNFNPYQAQNPRTDNFNNYQGFNYQQNISTNVIYVTSLDEALMKTNLRNSDMIYFDQDKDAFYRVKVDYEGRKTWAQFSYTAPNNKENIPATKADIEYLLTKIERLEQKVSIDVEVENSNVQSNG